MPKSKRVTPPASGEGANIPKPAAQADGNSASLLPEHYVGDGAAEAAPAPAPEPAPVEAAVVAKPVVEVVGASGDSPAGNSVSNRFQPGNLHRFPKGTSGNPNGRPKGLFNKSARKQLRKRAENGEINVDAVVGAQVDKAIVKADTAAATFLRDTVDGKPASQDDNGGNQIAIVVQLTVAGR